MNIHFSCIYYWTLKRDMINIALNLTGKRGHFIYKNNILINKILKRFQITTKIIYIFVLLLIYKATRALLQGMDKYRK